MIKSSIKSYLRCKNYIVHFSVIAAIIIFILFEIFFSINELIRFITIPVFLIWIDNIKTRLNFRIDVTHILIFPYSIVKKYIWLFFSSFFSEKITAT